MKVALGSDFWYDMLIGAGELEKVPPDDGVAEKPYCGGTGCGVVNGGRCIGVLRPNVSIVGPELMYGSALRARMRPCEEAGRMRGGLVIARGCNAAAGSEAQCATQIGSSKEMGLLDE